MKRTGLPVWLVPALCGSLLAGCASRKSDRSHPDDPLFASKKPLEARVEDARPTVIALGEPVPPSVPEEALAGGSRNPPLTYRVDLGTVERPNRSRVPTRTVSAPKDRVLAAPAIRSQPAVEPRATPAPQPNPAALYDHGANYTWLQGVLDKHYQGHLDLRYCDPAVDDVWGGKVCLEPDARLAQFNDGDIVFVEGDLIPPARTNGGWHEYPHFKVRQVQAVQRRP